MNMNSTFVKKKNRIILLFSKVPGTQWTFLSHKFSVKGGYQDFQASYSQISKGMTCHGYPKELLLTREFLLGENFR